MRHRLQRSGKENTSSSRDRASPFGLALQSTGKFGGDTRTNLSVLYLRERVCILYWYISEDGLTTHKHVLASQPKAVPEKGGVPRPMRSSVEGLNQEIERLVLIETEQSDSKYGTGQVTPEGHRAPLADLLRSTRSVNTQTPAGPPGDFTGSATSSGMSRCSSLNNVFIFSGTNSTGPPSRESVSPLIAGPMDTSRPPSDVQGKYTLLISQGLLEIVW
ncbi:unnamed protein product [Timema podura]|uniref:Uncharacterized protein n=1 Tax=Timema podura TaxID=61482 RepID=A0ABN7PN23_TIMPD|nr:unnamed protein product [Timema podura]